jgi:hypothetical protein
MPKYLSGRVKKTPQSALKKDINRFLSVSDSEPNLGDPVSPGDTPPFGQQYQIVSIEGFPGQRFWRPIGGGLIPGTISVYDETLGNLVGGPSSTTQLLFKGAAIRAEGTGNGTPENPYGIGVTITVFAPGNNQELLFNSANEFSTSSKLKFNSSSGLLSAGDKINVGFGGTVIATNDDGFVGISTINPTQKLHIQGNLRLTGTIYDYNNQPGTNSQILVKNNLGGLIWVNQSTIRAGAGGIYQNVQFHNSAALVDGASNFVYDEVNQRVGIGSTYPKTTLDVSGISSFKGGSIIDNLNVTGVTTTSTLAVTGTSTTRNLLVTGITTLGFVTATSAFFAGIITATKFIGAIDVTNLYVIGVSTFLQKANINNNLGVTGLTTTQNLQVYQLSNLNQLNVTGVSTFSSQVNINNLSVTGVGTFDNIKLDTNTISSLVGNLIIDSSAGTTQINDAVYVNDATESSNKDTGAIIVEGGVGIEKRLNVGGAVNLATSGGITTTGGDLYIGGDLYVLDDIFYDELFARNGNFSGIVTTNLLTVSTIKPTSIQDSSGGTGTNNFVLTANGSGGWTWKVASTSDGTSIETIKTTADSAVSAASAAQSTANSAVSAASAAQSTANSAVSAASAAQSTANSALQSTQSANQVLTQSNTTNADYFVTFVDSNNSSATSETIYTDADISYNPNTNLLKVGGAVRVGNANLSSGGDYAHLATYEYYNGSSWVYQSATAGGLYQITGQAHNWYKHNGSGTHTTLLTLDSSGNLVATANITAYSDIKLKENINTIQNALDKTLKLRGVTFTRKDIPEEGFQIGLIAQEVEEIIPEAVRVSKTETPEGTANETKTVAYGNMIGLLIEAVKDQQKIIEKLEKRIEDLENK